MLEEDSINDFLNGPIALVDKIETHALQCHSEFRTDSHKKNYLTDTVDEFYDWSLGRI